MIRKSGSYVLAVLLLATLPLYAKKATATTLSVKRGDAPPGDGATLSVSQARSVLKETMKSKYVGSMRYGGLLGVGSMAGELEPLANFRFRSGGFDVVAPFTWMGKHNDGQFSIDFKKQDYIESHRFKFGGVFYTVGALSDPRYPALGWGGMSGMVPMQFVWANEVDAEKFADAFNRLVYVRAGMRKWTSFQTFRVAAKAWRDNPAKPPLGSEAERHRILAEDAIKERNLDVAIEHYERGLEVQPMWPEGWFNLALIYGEQNNYADASDRMKHYLELAPDAPDAKSAREQLIIWEDKARR
jgi:hypothetical protein